MFKSMFATVLFVLFFVPAVALAQDEDAPPATTPDEQAETLRKEGTDLFTQGHFSEARERFEKCLSLTSSNGRCVYNLARTAEALGEPLLAVQKYELFLELEPQAVERPGIETRIRGLSYLVMTEGGGPPIAQATTPASPNQTDAEVCDNLEDDDNNGYSDCGDPACTTNPFCQPKPVEPSGQLNFTGVPTGATVHVDGKQVDHLFPTDLSVGVHDISVLDTAGRKLGDGKVAVKSGETSVWEFQAGVSLTREEGLITPQNLRWVATGMAVAAFGAAAYCGLEFEGNLETAETTHSQRRFDQAVEDGEKARLFTNISLGLGIAASAAAGYFWWESLRDPTVTPKIAPTLDGRGAGVSIGGNF